MQKLMAAMAVAACAAAQAGVTIESPWVRGTVAGQQASGVYMTLSSTTDATLVGVSTPAAEMAELHEMRLENGIMKMRSAPRLALPAGQPVELKPGGYHIMIMGLKAPLKPGDSMPLTLRVEGRDKRIETVPLRAEVRDAAMATPEHHHH